MISELHPGHTDDIAWVTLLKLPGNTTGEEHTVKQ